MALPLSQFTWGFEVFDQGSSQNNMIDVRRPTPTGNDWQATHAYASNALVVPSGANASSAQLWKCTTAGTSGGSQPTWPASPTPGVTTQTDGTVTWTFQNLVDYHAAIAAGVYTPDELAAAVQTALVAADSGGGYTCSFDYSALQFTIAGTSAFDIRWSSGTNHSKNASGLLGFNNAADKTNGTSFTSDSAIGGTYSTTSIWTALEPQTKYSPVSAQAAGSAAKLTQRKVRALQNITDGQLVETIYIGTLKKVQIEFRALVSSEQTKMESFLDWAVAGKRFTWQPDSTSTNLLKLVLASPAEVNDDFEWMARSEVTYGMLTFFEQLS